MTDGCRQVRPLLDDLVDGTLDDARARAARGHLRECVACRGELQAASLLRDAAQEIGSVDPPSGQWKAIAARLDAEEAREARRPRLWWWWQAARQRVVYGAGAMALCGAVTLVVFLRTQQSLEPALRALPRPSLSADDLYQAAVRDVERAGDDYASAIRDLRELVAVERTRWTPETARAFDENLAAIDGAIGRQADLARKDPGNPAVADALHASYRRQIDFLQDAVVRGQMGGTVP